MKNPPTAHLHFILAKEAPIGVIFRRGPDKWVQVIKWNTNTDTFEPGHWFHGRIYEKRSDLSPDGSKLVYFAQKFTWRAQNDVEYTCAWTAVSKMPYLTALALWPRGTSSDGGGTFISNTELHLNHPRSFSIPHPAHLPQGLYVSNNDKSSGEDEPVLNHRLARAGWHQVQSMVAENVGSPYAKALTERIESGLPCDVDWCMTIEADNRHRWITHVAGLHRKPNKTNILVLTMTTTMEPIQRASTKSYPQLSHRFTVEVMNRGKCELPNADWADFDQSGRLVFVRGGKVFAAENAHGVIVERELADFNGNRFEPVEAPEWATHW